MKMLNFNRDQIPVFIKQQLNKENLVVAEVGVEYGGYLDIYYPILNTSEIYLIDLWQTANNDYYFTNKPGQVELGYEIILKKYSDKKNIHICKNFSVDCAKNFPDEYFDWVYLDADHSEKAVLDDLSHWYPKVKCGGFISGHDCNPDPNNIAYEWFGVDNALLKYFNKNHDDIYLTNESYYQSWIYRKQ